MKRSLTLAWVVGFLLFFVVPGVAGSAGSLVERTVPGPSLVGNLIGEPAERDVLIYLPPGYTEAGPRRFPVLYLLHGILDSNTTWTRAWSAQHPGYHTIQELMDRGIERGLVGEMILVIPDADKSCHYTNSPVKGNWQDFLADPHVA